MTGRPNRVVKCRAASIFFRLKHSFAAIAFLLLPASLLAQSNVYSSWSNFPQSPSFFPIVLWMQNPSWSMGPGAPYSSVPLAMVGTKMNTLLGIDYGGGGGFPSSCGADTNGYINSIVSQHLYVIAVTDGTNSSSNPGSVLCLQQSFSNLNASQYLVGYNMGDEPSCTTMGTLPATVSTVQSYDTTRPIFWNFTDWVFGHGSCFPASNPTNISALQGISVGSFDVYPVTGPWNGSLPGTPQDSMWIQGWSVAQFVALGRPGQPIWAYPDSGTNELGYSSQNGNTCNASTNLCSPNNNEYRATAEQVNAEVWMQLINGAMGIEWFCDDTDAYNFCLGSTTGGEASVSAAIASNIAYINTTVLNYAPQLNSNVLGRCTMNTGTAYSSYTTSCSNGILTMSTGTATVPGSAIVKTYNGTLYLFAAPDRNGSATMTFALTGYGGATAKVVYDSNAQYDPSHSSVGATFTLNGAGQFSDTFGANGHNYQPKIYTITSASTALPAPPTNVAAAVH